MRAAERGLSSRRRPLALLTLAAFFAILPAGRSAASEVGAEGGPADRDEVEARVLDTRLLLIGDAGEATSADPVLRALTAEAARDSARTLVVFLGDNVYPKGVPAEARPRRAQAVERLRAQVDAVLASGARAVFIPGNHDWEKSGKGGWDAVRRQAGLVEAMGRGRVTFRPLGGCPGPEVVDRGERLRLVVLDTQWWLHPGPRPLSPADGCPVASEEGVLAGLRGALRTAGARRVVVVAHHPLRTGGPHGGAFGFKQHVFPLTEAAPWLWLPLPLVGSIYPAARRNGASDQDLSGERYQRMRSGVEEALAVAPPLAWASGHEHGLQVLHAAGGPLLLVSGAGTVGNVSYVTSLPETLFARAQPGFQRLDLFLDGTGELSVLGVTGDRMSPLFVKRLRPAAAASRP